MSTEAGSGKILLLMGALAVVALIINSCFANISQRIKVEMNKNVAMQKATQDAAAEHAKFLARYLAPGFGRKPGVKTMAVMVVSEDGKFNQIVSGAISGRFKAAPVETLPSFFTPEFVADGLFNEVFAGSSELPLKLELTKSLDMLLLARQRVEYSTNGSLQNLITADMSLEVVLSPIGTQDGSHAWTLTAIGAGFRPSDARLLAEKRLLQAIEMDSKMSLSGMSDNKPNQ